MKIHWLHTDCYLHQQEGIQPHLQSQPDISAYDTRLGVLEDRMRQITTVQSANADTVTVLEQDIAKNRDDIALVASGAVSHANTGPDTQNLQDEIARLSQDVQRLSALAGADDPDVSKLDGTIALLRAELDAVKAAHSAQATAITDLQSGALQASPRGRLVLALTGLKEKALSGLDVSPELAALRPDFSALPALDQQLVGAQLAKLTATPDTIKSHAVLVQDFQTLAVDIVQAVDESSGSILTRLFTVRDRGAGADAHQRILNRTEASLAAYDYQGAATTLTELATVDAALVEITQPWAQAARDRATTQDAYNALILALAGTGETP